MVDNKSAKQIEDIWVYEREKALLAKLKAEREHRIKEEEAKEQHKKREELKKTHWMCCPKCGHPMQEKALVRVKVDICTLCEGIYFDRGELEELMLAKQAEDRKGFFRKLVGLGKE
jgi:hypothetical protein